MSFIDLHEACHFAHLMLLWEALDHFQAQLRMNKFIGLFHNVMRAELQPDDVDVSSWVQADQQL